jgi:response regulator RpfG family c-di-GMP phosphodiesterase
MQHHLLRSTMLEAIQKKAWSDMEAEAEGLVAEPETLDLSALTESPNAFQAVHALLGQKRPRECHLTIVDRQWRTVLPYAGGDGEHLPPSSPGQRVSFTPSSNQAGDATPLLRGTLDTPDGPQIAVACPLKDGQGYLLLHRPADDLEAAAAPFVQPLLAVGVVALLWTVTLLSMTAYLIMKRHDDTLEHERAQSASGVLLQTQRLVRLRDALVYALAKLAGFRDDETGAHLERLSDYSTLLASALRHDPKFSHRVTPAFIRLIGLSSVPHDIGKVGIEDEILRKPSKLTPAERERMQLHTAIAGNCLGEIAERLGSSNFLEMAREIALAHHECWDGSGYPRGLKGEEIPLSARIVAIADVYDALSTPRVYKDALPHEQCVAIIRAAAGKQFDPDLVEVWLTIESKFREIASQYVSPASESKRTRFCVDGGETDEDEKTDREAPSPAPANEDAKLLAESSKSM